MALKRYRSTLYGALAGGLLALVLIAVFGSITALRSVDATVLDEAAMRARPEFVVGAGAMYFLVILLGLVGGLVITAIAYAFQRQENLEGEMFPLRYLLPTGAITAAIMAYVGIRIGIGAAGSIAAGEITVSVARLLVISVLSGAFAGAVTAATVGALARPEVLAIEGEAVPASFRAFTAEMVRAVGSPMIGVIFAAGFAIGLSQLLLAIEGLGAVAIFSVVGALVLGGATLLALRPWERRGKSSGQA